MTIGGGDETGSRHIWTEVGWVVALDRRGSGRREGRDGAAAGGVRVRGEGWHVGRIARMYGDYKRSVGLAQNCAITQPSHPIANPASARRWVWVASDR